MSRIVPFGVILTLFAPSASAEVLTTEPACAYPVTHVPDANVAAEYPNGPVTLPPLELELRRLIPVRAGWFIEASLGVIRVDLQTGAVAGQGGLTLSTGPARGCD